jgi:hypothetical protein
MRCPSPATPWYSSFSKNRGRRTFRSIPSSAVAVEASPPFRLNWLVSTFSVIQRGPSNASYLCLVCLALARACDARDGRHGAEFGRARRCRWRYHWWSGWRPARCRNRSRHRGRRRSQSGQETRALLLASWSLLGAHPRQIAPRRCPLLQVGAPAIRWSMRCSVRRADRTAGRCLLLAQTGHVALVPTCLLLGVERTCRSGRPDFRV